MAIILDPEDVCGCGDVGYLTVRTIPIDLAHGVGKIHRVPVYHCRSATCEEYTVPVPVSRRLEELAERMEASLATEMEYDAPETADRSTGATANKEEQNAFIQAFTLRFSNREYEDAVVSFVVPGEAIFLQSTIDSSEYYLLRYLPDESRAGTWFAYNKFYYDRPKLTYQDFLDWSVDGYIKELAVLALDEIEDTLHDEFGDII